MPSLEGHHPDCDGFRFDHRATVMTIREHGVAMHRAVCLDTCDWSSPPVGYFGAAEEKRAQSDAAAHGSWVDCDGRCASWT